MSQSGVVAWSKTASSNATADSAVNWAEGMAPSAVNDSARAEMASVAKYRDDTAGTLTTGGTSTAYTLTTNQSFSALTVLNGQELSVKFNATNGAAPTLNVDGLGAKAINVDTATAVGTGVIKANSIWSLIYDNSNSCFIIKGGASVATGGIDDSAVTYAKIQNVTDQRLLGNFSGAGAAPSEISVVGPSSSGSTLTFPFPPPSSFKNLSIKVATTTTVTVAADFVVTTNGSGQYQNTAVGSTINLGTTGVDALDTGTIAISTWYAIWVVAKADGTTSCIASTSATAPTMPAGYTYKARIGWVRTISSSATLYGTWQLGKRAQYIVGLAQTSQLPEIIAGNFGVYSTTAPTWNTPSVSSVVPSTASEIYIVAVNAYKGNSGTTMQIAPSNSYGGVGNASGKAPFFDTASTPALVGCIALQPMLLEGTTIAFASSGAGGAALCSGWQDNL